MPGGLNHWSQIFLSVQPNIILTAKPQEKLLILYVTVIQSVISIIFWVYGLFLHLGCFFPFSVFIWCYHEKRGQEEGRENLKAR